MVRGHDIPTRLKTSLDRSAPSCERAGQGKGGEMGLSSSPKLHDRDETRSFS